MLTSKQFWATSLLLFALLPPALAGHPFVTEDTGTQGRGNHQLESNTDWSREDDASAQSASFTYSYGMLENLDLFVNLPVTLSAPAGMDDISSGAKWRFYEDEAASLGLKAALFSPNGNQRLGHGNGHANLALTLIGSHRMAPWTLHGNLGVSTNRQTADSMRAGERGLLWQASAAVSYDLNSQWKTLADIGVSRNPDATGGVHPAYFLTGLIYSPREDVDLDVGAKFGLNRAESDHQVGIGLTWRF